MNSRNLTAKEKLSDALCEMETMVKVMFAQNQGRIPFPLSVHAEFSKKQAIIQRSAREVEEHIKVDEAIEELKKMNEHVDQIISNYQDKLQRVEHLLRTALYYSNQKLKSVRTAHKTPLDSDLIFKFSHQISASHGAVAPEGWMQGDPRRPYPLDSEMRSGYLDHIDDVSEEFRPEIYELLKNSLIAADDAQAESAGAVADASQAAGDLDLDSGDVRDPAHRSPSIGWLSSPTNSPPLLPTDNATPVREMTGRDLEEEEDEVEEEEEDEEEEEEDDEDEEESTTSRTSDLLPATSASTSLVVSPLKVAPVRVKLNAGKPQTPGAGADTSEAMSDEEEEEEEEVTEMMSTDDDSSSLSDAS